MIVDLFERAQGCPPSWGESEHGCFFLKRSFAFSPLFFRVFYVVIPAKAGIHVDARSGRAWQARIFWRGYEFRRILL